MSHQPDRPDRVDESVRALLGEARVESGMPAEVADRIDRALHAARPPAENATVVRFRRRVAGGLVAAAVLVVGGGVVAAQLRDSGGSDAASSSAAGADAAATAGGNAQKSAPNVLPGTTPSPEALSGLSPAPQRLALPRLRSTHFAGDVRALLATAPYAASIPGTARTPTDAGPKTPTAAADCAPPAGLAADANVREVTLDGRLATLVVDPVDASPRTATAYSCGGARTLAAAVLAR
jgi:hypothetical protein